MTHCQLKLRHLKLQPYAAARHRNHSKHLRRVGKTDGPVFPYLIFFGVCGLKTLKFWGHCSVVFNAIPTFSISRFYPNVTTLRSGPCYRNSVCRLSVCRLSSVSLSVTLVHPTQGVEPFGKISSPLCALAIL